WENLGRSVGLLYFINTLGSAIACFLTADLLFVFLGQQAAVLVAAAFNLLVGAMVWRYMRRRGGSVGSASADAMIDEPIPSAEADPTFLSSPILLLLSAAVGYISLSQELVWMRVVSY